MQNPTPVTVQSSVIVEVIILFTEHNNPQYFSEEKEENSASLCSISRANFNSLTVLQEKKKKN